VYIFYKTYNYKRLGENTISPTTPESY